MTTRGVNIREIVCRACKEPVRYDPKTSMKATTPKYPLCLFVVCSKECRKRVREGDHA